MAKNRRKPSTETMQQKTIVPTIKPGVGRPPLKVSWDTVDAMFAACAPSGKIVADALGVSLCSLEDYCEKVYGITLAQYAQKKRGTTLIRLRSKQIELALKGNTQLLIWTGKQYLGQADKQEIQSNQDTRIKIQLSGGAIELSDTLQQASQTEDVDTLPDAEIE